MKTARIVVEGDARRVTYLDGELIDDKGRRFHPDRAVFLPPVTPQVVVGLALNYADHAKELNLAKPEAPALFIKPNSSLLGHGLPVVYPNGAQYCHYEAELAVVIDRTCRRVPAERAMDYVKGFTVANDFTCRDFVTNLFRPPIKAKGFDTFGPLGPYLVTVDEVKDPHNLAVKSWVNGELKQDGNTQDLIYSISDIIEYVSQFLTLRADDVILTGTPPGISPVHPGDEMVCEVEGVGQLVNRVVGEMP